MSALGAGAAHWVADVRNAQGGSAKAVGHHLQKRVGFNPDPSLITIDGSTAIRADGTRGQRASGGFGQGGTAGISGDKGTITLGRRQPSASARAAREEMQFRLWRKRR